MTSITVFIPTYRRTKDLERCLNALKGQVRLPETVLLTVRDTDEETHEFLTSYNHYPLTIITTQVSKPGVIAAHNQGYKVATCDIIAITDDDSAPKSDWLERIEEFYLEHPETGGYGGRDLVHENDELVLGKLKSKVGCVTWFGKVIGNHHLGFGDAREVDVLKGVNSSYRHQVISGFQYDSCLRGSGTNSHWELALGLHAKSQGWKLVYEPALLVDHYPGKRVGMAERLSANKCEAYDSQKFTDSVFNQTYILLSYLPPINRTCFLAWSILVGTTAQRGFLQCIRFFPFEAQYSLKKFMDSVQGWYLGWRQWKISKSQKSAATKCPMN
jgi:glycosyltransferase involved in cell wall biosynthesis